MSNKQKAFLSLFLWTVIGAATAAVTKIGLIQIPPLSFAFLRFFLALILLSPFYISQNNLFREIKLLTPISLLATANIILFVIGLKMTTATISQILYAGSPIIIGLITHVLYKNKLTLKQFAGIIIGFIGVGIVIILPIIEEGKAFSGDLKGNLLISIGVVIYSLYILFSKKVQKIHSPLDITFVFILVTTVVLFPFFINDLLSQASWITHITVSSAASIIYISVFATIFTYLLSQYAIKHGGAIFASMNLYLTPILAYFAANVFLGEQLTEGITIGGILALLGIFFVTSK